MSEQILDDDRDMELSAKGNLFSSIAIRMGSLAILMLSYFYWVNPAAVDLLQGHLSYGIAWAEYLYIFAIFGGSITGLISFYKKEEIRPLRLIAIIICLGLMGLWILALVN